MGIFQKKQSEEELNGPLHFFDDYFREDLRNRGREYFEKAIDDNVLLFKKDLDTTVAKINTELHERVETQLKAAIDQINGTGYRLKPPSLTRSRKCYALSWLRRLG